MLYKILMPCALASLLIACGGGGGSSGDGAQQTYRSQLSADAEQAVDTLESEILPNYVADQGSNLTGTWLHFWVDRGEFTATYMNQSTSGDVIDEGFGIFWIIDNGTTLTVTECDTGSITTMTRSGNELSELGSYVGTVENNASIVTQPRRYDYNDTIDGVAIDENGYYARKLVKLSAVTTDTVAYLDDSTTANSDLFCMDYYNFTYDAPDFSVRWAGLFAEGTSNSESWTYDDNTEISRQSDEVVVQALSRTVRAGFY